MSNFPGILNVERVHKTTAELESAGIIEKQWGFSTDDLRIVCRYNNVYYKAAFLESATNAFTGNITIGGTLGVTGATTMSSDLTINSGS